MYTNISVSGCRQLAGAVADGEEAITKAMTSIGNLAITTHRLLWSQHGGGCAQVKANRYFSDELLAVLKKSKALRVRAGMGRHRFIGIWFVVVKDRILARSWSVKPDGWYGTFLNQPRGTIQVGKVEIAVRAVPVKNKGLRDAADRAYLEKYQTAWQLKYAKDLARAKSRATTIEFVPLRS